jgi:hypothetical protein
LPRVARLLAVTRLALGAGLATCLLCSGGRAFAQGPAAPGSGTTTAPPGDALAAGRALFAEALADEQAGRFAVALEKFERVKAIKFTAPIQYRIGACLEGLGKPAAAYTAYRAAAALGEHDAAMSDVVHASRDRVDALSRHVARVSVTPPDAAPPDLAVRIDDEPVPREALAEPIALEPGTHTVLATASGRSAFRTQILLPEGGQATLAIALPVETPAVAPAPAPAAEPATRQEGAWRGPLGWVLVGTGAALLAGATATLVLRHDDIASLQSACPNGLCPSNANPGDLTAMRNRALAEGPIAAALGAGAVVAAGLGVYFLVTSPSSRQNDAARISLAMGADGARLALSGRFR